jgi:hypothetical protein
MLRLRLGCVVWLVVASAPGVLRADGETPAFPGATGFGALSQGGRGGEVYHVTTLRDTGCCGSLRVGVADSDGPRTIVFDVGGEIELDHLLRIKRGRLTIAGQTAPGGGITLSGYPVAIEGANDIVLRFVRLRTGDSNVENRGGDLEPRLADALSIVDSERIIIDHVSASWSLDETLSLTESRDVTIQHCVFSESLHDSYHPDGPHGMGALVRGLVSNRDRRDGVGGYTFYGNLFAHHNARNPGVGGGKKEGQGLDIDFVNNVLYNWGSLSGHSLTDTGIRMNYVGNYLIAGPDTPDDKANVAFEEHHPGDFFVHQRGNRLDADRDRKHDGKSVGAEAFRTFSKDEIVSDPFPFARPTVLDADDAYEWALEGVGASRPRDSVDRRLIQEVRRREGRIIDSQRQVGGFADIEKGNSPMDRDEDGMPDTFEEEFGLDPERDRDSDAFDLSDSGFTNLEVYLHSLVREYFPDESALGGPGPFLRSDCDSDGSACGTVNDAIFLLSWLFAGQDEPGCLAACDADFTGELDLSDVVFGLNACLVGNVTLSPPFPSCGHSPRPADRALGCRKSLSDCPKG